MDRVIVRDGVETKAKTSMRYTLVVPIVFSITICVMSSFSVTPETEIPPTQPSDLARLKPKPPELPEWLQIRPEGWADSVWYEYQQWLIDFRAPIVANRNYSKSDMEIQTAKVELMVGNYEHHIKREWEEKWSGHLVSYERTGGCGCCNEVYTVTGPRAAIEEFPVDPDRRNRYPRYLELAESD